MRWSDGLEQLIDWFVSPGTISEVELKAALKSVPNEKWATALVRLSVTLQEEKGKHIPHAGNVSEGIEPWVFTEEELRNYDLLDRKEQLLRDENEVRQAGRR